MNRMGMSSNASPFTQMSFETTGKFLQAAVATNDHDTLQVPFNMMLLILALSQRLCATLVCRYV